MYQSKSVYRIFLILTLLLLFPPSAMTQGSDVPKAIIAFAEEVLMTFARSTPVLEAVRNQNRRGISLEEIQRIDREWIATPGITRFMLNLMSNDGALALYNLEEQYRFIVEAFIMDNLGANVALTKKTSDYWQGDEAKFIQSYNNGLGAIHYSDIEYDESTDDIVIQVSVPVMDQNRAIGAITFSISLERWERR